MPIQDLKNNAMMTRLLDAIDSGQDIGHYGRLVFAMVARHFLTEDELVEKLARCPNFDQRQAKALLKEVQAHDYNPPRPEKIKQWQSQQQFQICPTNDPDACNVYKDLKFPNEIYDHINQYHEQKV